MGKKPKDQDLIDFILSKNPDVNKKEILISVKDVIDNPEIKISRNTIYKIANRNNFLSVKNGVLYYCEEEWKFERIKRILIDFYSKYDPDEGKMEINRDFLLEEEKTDDLELLQRLHELDFIHFNKSKNTLTTTPKGIKTYQPFWREGESVNSLEICYTCHKPLSLRIPTIGIRDFEEYAFLETHHSTCYHNFSKEEDPVSYSCAFCGLPISILEFENNLLYCKYSYSFENHQPILKLMNEDDRNQFLTLAIKNFLSRGFKEFQKERGDFRKEATGEIKTKANLLGSSFGLVELLSKNKLQDPLKQVIDNFIRDFKIGIVFENFDPEIIFRVFLSYQIAEFQAFQETKQMIQKEVQNFVEYTGLVEERHTTSEFQLENIFRSGLNTIIKGPRKTSFMIESDSENLYHPKCYERSKREEIIEKKV
ncbi:MAG: hypothetical protein ACW964_01465 [Candidatus Hodarchaeales archaeon]|jgi:hypothetical protein